MQTMAIQFIGKMARIHFRPSLPMLYSPSVSYCTTQNVNRNHESPVSEHAPNKPLVDANDDSADINNNSKGGKDYNNAIHEDRIAIFRRFFEHSKVRGDFNNLKATLKPILVDHLEDFNIRRSDGDELSVESGLKTAAAIDLLKLFNASNARLDDAGKRAYQGAILMAEGEKQVKAGMSLLETAFEEIPKNI